MPSSKIILTKTNRANATPHPNDIDYGELAINYNDGLLFFKNNDNKVAIIASSSSFTALNSHISNRNNPHQITKQQIGLGNVDNISDANKPISNATQTALNTKVNLTTLQSDYYDKGATITQIQNKFNAIGVSVEAPNANFANGNLSYDKTTNVFTYIRPTIPSLSDLGGVDVNGITVNPPASPVRTGTLSYIGNGQFVYDSPTITGLGGYSRSQIGLNFKTADIKNNGTLTYNDGFFTYDIPTISGLTAGKITLVDDVLTVAGYAKTSEVNDSIVNLTARIEDIEAEQITQDAAIDDKVINDGGVSRIKKLTQVEYDALGTPNSQTLYVIVN